MKIRNLLIVALATTSFAVAGCGNGNNGTNNGETNNGANNGGTNNGGTNNGGTNNHHTNNGGTNNGGTNNGGTNNGGTNNNTTGTNNNTTGTNNNTNTGNPQTCNGSFGAPEACGGDPTGTWTLDGICSDYDYESAIQQACANATVSDVTFLGSGTLVVAGNSWAYDVTGTATTAMQFPAECNVLGCNGTATAIETAGAQSATCTDDGAGGCNCDAVFDASNASAGTYTTDGNGTSTIGPDGETYYYCVSGGTLQLRQYGTAADDAQPTYLLSN